MIAAPTVCEGVGEGAVRASRAWLPSGERSDVWIAWNAQGQLTSVRQGRASDGALTPGVVLPGFVNAHAHLELSHLAGRVSGGAGFLDWLSALRAHPPRADDAELRSAAEDAHEAGTAWLGDVCNGPSTRPTLLAAGLHGVVHRELLGYDAGALPGRLEFAANGPWRAGDVAERPSPHAPLSTPVDLISACVHALPDGPPASMHIAECAEEAALLWTGSGPAAELLEALRRDWRWWTPPRSTAVEHLAAAGLLGPRLLLVHGVWLGSSDVALVRNAGAAVCVCPRSNLHILGRLPPVAAMLAAGVPVLLATDSLASSPDLDLLGEVRAIAERLPEVPMDRWIEAITHTAADHAGARGFGRVEVGAAPGLLHLADLPDLEALRHRTPAERSWLLRPPRPRGEP